MEALLTFERATYSPCCSLTRSFLRSMIIRVPCGKEEQRGVGEQGGDITTLECEVRNNCME